MTRATRLYGWVELRLSALPGCSPGPTLSQVEFRCPVRRCRRRRRVWPDSVSSYRAHSFDARSCQACCHRRRKQHKTTRATRQITIYVITVPDCGQFALTSGPAEHPSHTPHEWCRLAGTLHGTPPFFLETSTPAFGLCECADCCTDADRCTPASVGIGA